MNYDSFYDAFRKVLKECDELALTVSDLLEEGHAESTAEAKDRLEVLKAKLSALHCFAEALGDD